MMIEFPWWIYPALVWTLFWKGLAMWRAAKNNQTIWFVASLLLNTFGILPIVYLYFFQQDWNGRVSKKKIVHKKTKKKVRKGKKFPTLA